MLLFKRYIFNNDKAMLNLIKNKIIYNITVY